MQVEGCTLGSGLFSRSWSTNKRAKWPGKKHSWCWCPCAHTRCYSDWLQSGHVYTHKLLPDTSNAFLLKMCLNRFAEFWQNFSDQAARSSKRTSCLTRVCPVPCYDICLSSAQPDSAPPAPCGTWCVFSPSLHWGTTWARVRLQRCNFSNPGLKITAQRC